MRRRGPIRYSRSMSQDLLAPPKLKPRVFAGVMGAVFALPMAGGIWLALRGQWSVGEVGWRLLLLATLWVGAVMGYARLLEYSRRMRPERLVYVHMLVGVSSFALMAVAIKIMFGGTGLAS